MSFVEPDSQMTTLLKVPWILAVSIAIHITYKPPSIALKVVKQPTPISLGSKAFDRIAISLPVLKSFVWIIGIAEIIVITLPFITTNTPHPANLSNAQGSLDRDLHFTPFSIIGGTLILLGAAIRIVCYRALKSLHTFRLSIVENHKLITTGPYNIVRHPSYTGVFFVNTGVTLWYFSPGSIIVEVGGVAGTIVSALCIATVLRVTYGLTERIKEEDEMLKGAFGEQWARWAKAVPYVLVPGLY